MTTKKILGITLGAGLLYMLVKPNKNNNDISDTSNENMSPSFVHFHSFPERDNADLGWHRLCEIESLVTSGAFSINLSGVYKNGQVPGISATITWLYSTSGSISVQSDSLYTQNLRIVKDINTNRAFLDCYFAADGAISLVILGYGKIVYYDNAPLVD